MGDSFQLDSSSEEATISEVPDILLKPPILLINILQRSLTVFQQHWHLNETKTDEQIVIAFLELEKLREEQNEKKARDQMETLRA